MRLGTCFSVVLAQFYEKIEGDYRGGLLFGLDLLRLTLHKAYNGIRFMYRILGLTASLLFIGCTDWSGRQQAVREVDLYGDVELMLKGTIPRGTVCRYDRIYTGGKVYGLNKIECEDGQFGFVIIGGPRGKTHRDFLPLNDAK